MEKLIRDLPGPILVLGSGGFIGQNLFKKILAVRKDVKGTVRSDLLSACPGHLMDEIHLNNWLNRKKDKFVPRTTFNLLAHTGKVVTGHDYSRDEFLCYQTNFILVARFLERISSISNSTFIHAGSSVEYGTNVDAPPEFAQLEPLTPYAVSKAAASGLVNCYGKNGYRTANLRLYSVYGQHQNGIKLIPSVVREAKLGKLPAFGNPEASYDFIHVDDICRAFILAALNLKKENYGEAFNIGTGHAITLKKLAEITKKAFDIKEEPTFHKYEGGTYHSKPWRANTKKAEELLGFKYNIELREGLKTL